MSNATIRRHLERTSAPVVAMLIAEGWVVDDCGILNAQYGNIREGILVCTRALNGAAQVRVPVPSEMLSRGQQLQQEVMGATRVRERL